MSTIESRLADAFEELELPSTDLVPAVMAELSTDRPGRVTHTWSGRPGPILVAAAVFVAVAAALIVQPTREVLASWLGIGATSVEIVDQDELDSLPEPTRRQTPSTEAEDTEAGGGGPAPQLDPIPALGQPVETVSVETARGRRYLWPASLELPALAGGDIGAILSVRLVDGPLDLKRLAADEEVRHLPVEVEGALRSAVWIGSDHAYVAAGEQPVRSEQVLIWVVDDVQYRLEADLSVEEMIDLAEQVDYGTELLQPG